MVIKIFYSWQSDLPNKTNRGFVGKCLENVAKDIHGDLSLEVEPVIDRDTAGVAGAPDIIATILRKIDESQIFACDVSIVTPEGAARPSPNPNVLVELGYAMKTLGSERIILLLNSAFGMPELLPFDLRMRRVTTYNLSEHVTDASLERKKLQSVLAESIRIILELPVMHPAPQLTDKDPIVRVQVNSFSGIAMDLTLYNGGDSGAFSIKVFLKGVQVHELDFLEAHQSSRRSVSLKDVKEGPPGIYEIQYHDLHANRYKVSLPGKSDRWWEPQGIRSITKNDRTTEYW